MKLKLEKLEDRFLDVELPDSSNCRFIVKFATLLEAKENDNKLKELKIDHESGKIDSLDYLSGTVNVLVSNWEEVKDQVFNSGLQASHLNQIAGAILDLQSEKESTEKKNQSLKNMKD